MCSRRDRLKTLKRALERLGDYEWIDVPYRARKVVVWGLRQREGKVSLGERLAFLLKGTFRHRCIAVSEGVKGHFVRELGVAADRITVPLTVSS